jgi:hypothetical protein
MSGMSHPMTQGHILLAISILGILTRKTTNIKQNRMSSNPHLPKKKLSYICCSVTGLFCAVITHLKHHPAT